MTIATGTDSCPWAPWPPRLLGMAPDAGAIRDIDWDGVRLHIVTGKGGTGKTTVAAALALGHDEALEQMAAKDAEPLGDSGSH